MDFNSNRRYYPKGLILREAKKFMFRQLEPRLRGTDIFFFSEKHKTKSKETTNVVFKVKFDADESESNSEYPRAVNVKSRYMGTNDVKTVRDRTKENTDYSIMDGYVRSITQNVEVFIEEATATSISLFERCCHVIVRVEAGQLNNFVEEYVHVTRNSKTDAVEAAGIRREVNLDKVLAAWIEAGTPLFWQV